MHEAGRVVFKERPPTSALQQAVRRFLVNRRAVVGAVFIAAIVILAIFAPWVSPFDPYETNLAQRLESPNATNRLGTDDLGRDILSRIIFGTRISLMVGIVSIGISVTIGVAIGAVSGYAGGRTDSILMRIADTFLAFPSLVLAIAMVAVLGASLINVMIALGITLWVNYARVIRGNILALKEEQFVEAARSIGASSPRVLFVHIMPNAIAPIIVLATLGMAYAIIGEASLSFLGLGAQPPDASWGAMLTTGRDYMRVASHIAISPGLAIMITVLAFNLLGDGLRDALDPRLVNE